MNNYKNKNLILKTIRFDEDLHSKIEKLATDNERNFTEQVRFMLKEYIKIKEN